MMRTAYTIVALVLAGPALAGAQTPTPRPSPAEAVRVLEAAPSPQNWTGRAIYVPTRPSAEVVTTGASTSAGPFGTFAPPVPERRLDGSSWLEPAWEMHSHYPTVIIAGRPHPRPGSRR